MKQYYVYIMANKYHGTLYTGVTGDLIRRAGEHRGKKNPGFTYKYNITKLVYYEILQDSESAIKREKHIKNLLRRKKINLIESFNPQWEDLYNKIID